jgi:hypothetical protein
MKPTGAVQTREKDIPDGLGCSVTELPKPLISPMVCDSWYAGYETKVLDPRNKIL